MPYERLFRPISISGRTAKNRLVFPPCVVNFGGPNGEVTDTAVAYYEPRARGGAGTVIVEAAYVQADGKITPFELGVHEDALVPGLRRLAAAIQRHGALALLQINHCGRQGSSRVTGVPIISSSAVPSPTVKELPRALTTAEVQALVVAYAAAAARAQEAGFDGVEIHGAHGYLVAQFMSPYVNQRDDGYGGDASRRMRFPLEIIAAIRERCGERFLIFFRFSADEYVPGGLTLEDTKPNAKLLEAAGVDVLHVSAGNYETSYIYMPVASLPRGNLVHLAEAIKPLVKVPVITVGKIGDPEFAEGILAAGRADMVAVGRGLMADPEFPNKAAAGRAHDIQKCIGCRTCVRRLSRNLWAMCPANPMLGREQQFARPAERRAVLVVGSGPAALEAARSAALRGHTVTLLADDDGPLGGALAGAAGPKNDEAAMILKFIAGRLPKVAVAVRSRSRNDGASVAQAADVVLVEEGAEGLLPPELPRQTLPVPTEPHGLLPALEAGAQAALAIVGKS